jgi:hypothetical protein
MDHNDHGAEQPISPLSPAGSAGIGSEPQSLALPTIVTPPAQRGDWLVRRLPQSGLWHSAVVVSGEVDVADLTGRGVPVESAGPGTYVKVLERSPGDGAAYLMGLLLADASGEMPDGQILLRGVNSSDVGVASAPVEEAGRTPTPSHGPGTGSKLHPTSTGGVLLLSAVRREVADQARTELQRWRTGTGAVILESHAQGMTILASDYWPAAGIANPAAALGANWWSTTRWSAAFVSYTVNTAAHRMGLRDLLRGSAAHMRYTWQAYRDRTGQRTERYWAYPPDQVPPEPGDIIVKARGRGVGATWNDVISSTYQGRQTHGDIVVAVTNMTATVIGGNVGNSVRQRSYPLTNGLVNTSLPANDANRVFAILKLVGSAA